MESVSYEDMPPDPIESYEALVTVLDVIHAYENKIARAQKRLKAFTRGGMQRRFGRNLIEKMQVVHNLEDNWLSANADRHLPSVPPRRRDALEAQLNAARENYRAFFRAAVELINTEPASVNRAGATRVPQS